MILFSNPRLRAKFTDWPSGRNRVQCVFQVHRAAKGWRVSRATTDKHGAWCKPKLTTFAGHTCIVDGDDGKTYILEHAGQYDFITIRRSDLLCASQAELGHDYAVFSRNLPERHAELLALIAQAKPADMPVE